MLVLPIINRGRVLNVSVKLKNAKKARHSVRIDDIKPSDIIIIGQNRTNYKDSSYKNNKNYEDITAFIRNNNRLNKNDYLVTTKEEPNSNNYDVYQIDNPPERVSSGWDKLYGQAIVDMKEENPHIIKGRYINLKSLGIADGITEDKLNRLEFIANNTNGNYKKTLEKHDLDGLIDILNFLDYFECEVIKTSSIKQEDFEKTINLLTPTYSKDAKSLNNYYDLAISNKEVYSKLSRLYNIVYKEPLNWIQSSKNKVKVKKDDRKVA